MSDFQSTALESRLIQALQELGEVLWATSSFPDLMQQFVELSMRSVRGALTCAIVLAGGGRFTTVAAADAVGRKLDKQQDQTGGSPCLQALQTSRIVSVPDLANEQRWDGYPRQAMTYGVSAVYCSPLNVRGDTVGVLNLYGAKPRAFDDGDCAATIAQIVALAGVAITGTLRKYGDLALTDRLHEALSNRLVIEHALGIIMETQHCTAIRAFEILRGACQGENLRLAQIAQELVDRTAVSS